MGEMRALDETGDYKIIWDKNKQDETDHARETFERFMKKGYTAFSVKANGDKDVKITNFDPCAEKLILVPKVMGG